MKKTDSILKSTRVVYRTDYVWVLFLLWRWISCSNKKRLNFIRSCDRHIFWCYIPKNSKKIETTWACRLTLLFLDGKLSKTSKHEARHQSMWIFIFRQQTRMWILAHDTTERDRRNGLLVVLCNLSSHFTSLYFWPIY